LPVTPFIFENTINLDCGVLDIKLIENNKLIVTANSNDTFSIIKLFSNEDKMTFELLKTVNFNSTKTDTCNVVDINLNTNNLLFGLNDGTIKSYDYANESFNYSQKQHDYSIWSILSYDTNTFYSGSDDSKILAWDIRENKSINFNKEHTAGVTSLYRDITNDNVIISGSYDERINHIDVRKPRTSLGSFKSGKTVWDFKQANYHDKNLFFVSCIYDGFKVYAKQENTYNLEEILDFPEHQAIVYGVDIKQNESSIDVVSCSFYDNLICSWNFS